nr:hypothetical protein GCM10020241_14110 [Streptoalloteichus tenebrarius]
MIAELERPRFWPGAIAEALDGWTRFVHGPTRALLDHAPEVCPCPGCQWDDPAVLREALRDPLLALPRGAARELRALLRPLDEISLARSVPTRETTHLREILAVPSCSTRAARGLRDFTVKERVRSGRSLPALRATPPPPFQDDTRPREAAIPDESPLTRAVAGGDAQNRGQRQQRQCASARPVTGVAPGQPDRRGWRSRGTPWSRHRRRTRGARTTGTMSTVKPPPPSPWAAVVLAGGRARRLGGCDKVALTVGDRTLLDGVLAAVAAGGADPVVVVGPPRTTALPVLWAREDPPGGGPLAGLAEGLRAVPAEVAEVAVLAGDLAAVGPGTLDRLRAALRAERAADGAVLVDEHGHVQWLLGVWRAPALRSVVPERGAGLAVRAVLGHLTRIDVPALPGETLDVDTPDDLRAARGASTR